MNSILSLGGVLLGIFVLVQLVMIIIIVSRLVKLPLWAPLPIPIQRQLADDSRPVLDTAQSMLEQAGFRYTHTRKLRPLRAIDELPAVFCDVYYHSGQDIHAEVYLAEPPTPDRLCSVYLWNTFVDGSSLLTVNNLKHTLIPYPREVKVADGYAPDFAGHVAAHLAARESIAAARTDPADALAIARDFAETLLPKLQKENQVYRRGARDGEPVYGFRFLAAVKAAWRMRTASARLKKKNTAAGKAAIAPQFPEAARISAERIAFVRTLCALRGMRAPRWFRRTVFVFSGAAFLGLGSWWWGPAAAVTIAAVIVVHEAGHWLAMKLADFRDVQVFFVPGMGGATSGEKHEASPITHLLVYLAGPLPGLLLSLAVFAWVAFGPEQTNTSWYPLLLTGAVASFFINALNLLPVLPLDGGRVIELFLVGRLPWLRFIFTVASGSLLLIGGMASHDNVTRGIGIVMLVSSQLRFRIAKASALLIKEKIAQPSAAVGFASAAQQLHDFLARPAFQKWNYQTKLTVGQALLPRFLGRMPSWKETALGMGVYLACVLLPLILLAALLVIAPTQVLGAIGQGVSLAQRDAGTPPPNRQLAEQARAEEAAMAAAQKAARAERTARLAQAKDQPQRLALLKEMIESADENEDPAEGLGLAKQYYAETQTLADPARERAEAALALSSALQSNGDGKQAADPEIDRLRQEAERIMRARQAAKPDKADALVLVQALRARSASADKNARLAAEQEIVALLTANLEQSDSQLIQARRLLVRALDGAGQSDAAELELRAVIADSKKSATSKPIASMMERDLAWMLIAHRKLDEARLMVASHPEPSAEDPFSARAAEVDAHLIELMVARLKGDWNGVRQQAIAIREMKGPKMGNWFLDWMVQKSAQPDMRATLMLIDAERALGHAGDADKLAAALRKSNAGMVDPTSNKVFCMMRAPQTGWQREFRKALADIEQRELQCSSVKAGNVEEPAEAAMSE